VDIANSLGTFEVREVSGDAFSKVADLLTHYCLNLVMTEWSNTKIMGLAIEGGEEEAVEFDPESLTRMSVSM
jgi:hypothetical protein